MQFFSIILGIAYLGMGIGKYPVIADGIHAWLGWDESAWASFLAFILGYFPLIGSICGVANSPVWGWGLATANRFIFGIYHSQ